MSTKEPMGGNLSASTRGEVGERQKPEGEPFRYWAFISYSHKDKSWGDWLHPGLDSYRTPKPLVGLPTQRGYTVPAKLYPVFRDQEELPTNAKLSEVITDALRKSRYLVVICSPRSEKSEWVNKEILFFKSLGREDYILPIIVDGEPNASDKPELGLEECFPKALKFKWEDGSLSNQRTEPLAADARPGHDRERALFKLRAGLLGVNLDDLIQREMQRQRQESRRNLIIAGAMLGLAALAGTGGWIAWQKSEAERQAKEQEILAKEETQARLRQAQISESRFLTEKAQAAQSEGNTDLAMNLVLAGLPASKDASDRPFEPEAVSYLASMRAVLQPNVIIQGKTISLSPNGKWVITTDGDAAYVWDAQNGALLTRLSDGFIFDSVILAEFSQDSMRVVVVFSDSTASVMDLSGAKLTELRGHESRVVSAKFSPDGTKIVTASSDNTARLWNAQNGVELAVLRHKDSVDSAMFSPDGTQIVTTSSDGARLWNAQNGKELFVLGQLERIYSAAFTPDGKKLITTSYIFSNRVWDTHSGAQLPVPKHRDFINTAALSPDGTKAVTITKFDNIARIVDVQSGDEIKLLYKSDVSNRGQPVFSHDGTKVAISYMDNTTRVWDAQSGNMLTVLRHEEHSIVKFSPDGTHVVTESGSFLNNAFMIWNVSSNYIRAKYRIEELVGFDKTNPKGTKANSTWEDFNARVWDAKTGDELVVLRGHEGKVISAKFSPDGTRVITLSSDRTARVWDAKSGTTITKLEIERTDEDNDYIMSAEFSPDGTRVVMASYHDAQVWDAQTGAKLAVLRGHEGPLWYAEFSPDGKRVVTASMDNTARVWDANSGTILAVLRGHEDSVTSAEFSPDGTRVVTASHDNTAREWDAQSGAELTVLRGHEDSVTSAEFSPDGTRVVTASQDKTARVWDAQSGAEIAVLRGQEAGVTSAEFSPDGSRVVTISEKNGIAQEWDAQSGAQLNRIAARKWHKNNLFYGEISPDGTRLVTRSREVVAIYNTQTPLNQSTILNGYEGMVQSPRLSPDETRVVTISYDNTARVWDAQSGAELVKLLGHEDSVESAEFSLDGRQVVTASRDKTARVWDAQSGAQISKLKGHEGSVTFARFSPDGTQVITASDDKTVRIWNANNGTQRTMNVLLDQDDNIKYAVFSPDNSRVVTASDTGTVRVWDTNNGTHLILAEVSYDRTDNLAPKFSPDGRWVITTDPNSWRNAQLWDAQSGAKLAVLHDVGTFVKFSPDGTKIVTLSDDKTVRLWEAQNGLQIAALNCELYPDFASFSLDGTKIAVADNGRYVQLWDVSVLNLANLLSASRASVLRPLSRKEREQHFLADPNTPRPDPLPVNADSTQAEKLWQGDGVPKDRQSALGLWQEAAARGDARAHQKLGWVYELGREGVIPKDLEKALLHYAIAAKMFEAAEMDEENAVASARRGSLARSLPMGTSARIWEQAMAWRPSTTQEQSR